MGSDLQDEMRPFPRVVWNSRGGCRRSDGEGVTTALAGTARSPVGSSMCVCAEGPEPYELLTARSTHFFNGVVAKSSG